MYDYCLLFEQSVVAVQNLLEETIQVASGKYLLC